MKPYIVATQRVLDFFLDVFKHNPNFGQPQELESETRKGMKKLPARITSSTVAQPTEPEHGQQTHAWRFLVCLDLMVSDIDHGSCWFAQAIYNDSLLMCDNHLQK